MAVRRQLLRPLPAHVGDDCIIPLDVVAAGALVRHAATAIAHDVNETRIHRELRARARMTARNWTGTWMHPRLLSPLHHPGFAFALWSHKLLRWLSPVLLAMMGGSALLLSPYAFLRCNLWAGRCVYRLCWHRIDCPTTDTSQPPRRTQAVPAAVTALLCLCPCPVRVSERSVDCYDRETDPRL